MKLRHRIGWRIATSLIFLFFSAVLAAQSYWAMAGFLVLPALAVGAGIQRERQG